MKIRNLNSTHSGELSQYSHNGSFTYIERLCFQSQFEKTQTPVIVTKLYIVPIRVFNNQLKHFDWSTATDNSKSRFTAKDENIMDKESW